MRNRYLYAVATVLAAAATPSVAQITLSAPPGAAKEQLKKPEPLQLRRIDLSAIEAALPEATLEFYFYGDAAPLTDMMYVDPSAKIREVEFRTNIFKNSKVHAVRWQVTRAPFAGPVDSPAALVASGTTTDRVFAVDFADVARKAGLIVSASTANQNLTPSTNVNRLRKMLPGGTDQQADAAAPQLDPSVRAVMSATGGSYRVNPKFYVRVIPVDPANPDRIIGKPSEALPVVWGEKPNREVAPTGFDVESKETYNLSFAGFVYHPSVTIENWPAGCEPIPRDDGADAGDVIVAAGEAAIDFVNWASEAYADLKNIVISIAGDLLPFVPESVLSVALDVAMASAGLPPSLPNVDQLMEGGADYLAVQMAAQIPTPASGVLAEMAAEEARAEIQRRTKEAILASAREIAKKRKDETKWCTRYISDPYFEVKVRNNGAQVVDSVGLAMKPGSELLGDMYFPIDHMEPGETLTLPIAYRAERNVPWRWVSQMPHEDRRAADSQWWSDYDKARFAFTFYLPESRECYGDGRCEDKRNMVYKTTTQRWD